MKGRLIDQDMIVPSALVGSKEAIALPPLPPLNPAYEMEVKIPHTLRISVTGPAPRAANYVLLIFR